MKPWFITLNLNQKSKAKQWNTLVIKEVQADSICEQGDVSSIFFIRLYFIIHSGGVIMIGYLEKGKTINGQYYALEF